MEVRPLRQSSVPAGYKQTEVGVIPEEWEVAKIAAVCFMKSGEGITSTSIDQFSEYPCYGGNGLRGFTTRFTHDGRYALIGRQGALCGNVLGVEGKLFASEHAIVVTPSARTDIRWLTFVLGEMRLNQYSESSAQPGLSVSKLLNLDVARPPTKAEQEAIAGTLSDADALIESLEQLLAKKHKIKQGAMQELLTGKKRLPGFSGEWTEEALGGMGHCYRGVSYNPAVDLSSFDTESTIRLLRANNVKEAKVVFEDVQYVDSSRVSADQRLRGNDILICMASGSRELVGKAGRFSADDGFSYTFGAFMGCFRPDYHTADPDFVFYLFQTAQYRAHVAVLLAGSSINNLTPGSIEAFLICVPSDKAEQTVIAAILSNMDEEITALEAKLTKARQLKQGMMQELLTGRIRLI